MYRYSQRLAWSGELNPFTSLVEQKRADGAKLLDLTISNPTQAMADYPHALIAETYSSLPDFRYHPDPLGILSARQQIADWYAQRNIKITAEQLALTASTSEAYSLLFKLLLNPGEEVLIPMPSYPLFEYLAKLEGVALRPYQLLYDGSWHIDLDSVRSAISEQTRAIIVVNPNNPTGSFLKLDECVALEQLSLEHGLPLIADEVFMDYAFSESTNRISTLIGRDNPLSFSLNGLSKAAGMPQMKLGWIAVNGPKAERQRALHRLELLLDTYLSVSTPVQTALGDLLKIGTSIQHAILTRLHTNRKQTEEILAAGSIRALHGEGGWSTILRVPAIWTEEEWITRLLRDQSVIVQPGYFFDMPMEGCLLVSLLTEPNVFADGLHRLAAMARAV